MSATVSRLYVSNKFGAPFLKTEISEAGEVVQCFYEVASDADVSALGYVPRIDPAAPVTQPPAGESAQEPAKVAKLGDLNPAEIYARRRRVIFGGSSMEERER